MPDLPIHFTEWSSSFSSRDPIHDGYIQASYIMYNIKRLSGMVESMSYWTFSDIFKEVGPGLKPFHGGFGLMNMQSFRKPSFYATCEYLHTLTPGKLLVWIGQHPTIFSRGDSFVVFEKFGKVKHISDSDLFRNLIKRFL